MKFVIKIEILQHIEHDNIDLINLKRTYEVCDGIQDLVSTMKEHYSLMKNYIATKLIENEEQ